MPKFNLKLYNFEKPGKGVEVDEKTPIGIINVFILYFRNFWKMTVFNTIYFAVTLPILSTLASYIIILLGDERIKAIISADNFQSFNQSYPWVMIWVNVYNTFAKSTFGLIIGVILLSASILCFGPFTASLVYCSRNTVRGEHVFISDIFSQAWENRKQALLFGIIDIAIVFSIATYFFADFGTLNQGYASLTDYLKYIALFVFIIYLVVRAYMYIMTVTFEMSLKNVMWNSMLLMYTNILRTLLILLTIAIVIALNVILPLPSLLLLPLFDLSFIVFATTYAAYKPIEKHMINPTLEQMEKEGKEANSK